MDQLKEDAKTTLLEAFDSYGVSEQTMLDMLAKPPADVIDMAVVITNEDDVMLDIDQVKELFDKLQACI